VLLISTSCLSERNDETRECVRAIQSWQEEEGSEVRRLSTHSMLQGKLYIKSKVRAHMVLYEKLKSHYTGMSKEWRAEEVTKPKKRPHNAWQWVIHGAEV